MVEGKGTADKWLQVTHDFSGPREKQFLMAGVCNKDILSSAETYLQPNGY